MADEEKVEGQVGTEEQEPKDEGQRDAGDKGEQPPTDGKWIPKHRFDEVNTALGAFRKYGKPEDIERRLARLDQLEKLPANRVTDREADEIRKELLHVFPQLGTLITYMDAQRETYIERGASLNNDFLKELGLEVNDTNNQYLQELLSGVIASDKKLLRRFGGMDQGVFKDAFEIAKKTFWPGVKRPVPGAGVQAKKEAPKTPIKQGEGKGAEKKETGPTSRLEEREYLDSASEKAFELLEASRSE